MKPYEEMTRWELWDASGSQGGELGEQITAVHYRKDWKVQA